jgi:ATP synthase protein I
VSDDDLSERIRRARAELERQTQPDRRYSSETGAALAMQYAFGLIAAVLIGVMIGLTIDKFAGTGPWGLLIFMLFGTAAGFLNIFRAARAMSEAAAREKDRPPGSGHPTDET